MTEQKLPVGIESFAEMRQQNFYYVDKTSLISELLNNWGKVNLFTRPRRFGKTLNMSMLKSFFEIGTDPALFDGLAISRDTKLCAEYMGKFPVVFVSLKDVDGIDFASAYARVCKIIREEALRLRFLLNSEAIAEEEKVSFARLLAEEYLPEDIADSLRFLVRLLTKHYGQKTILLIDEYDVPLDKAFQQGYYDQMVHLMRSMFHAALKTNDNLYMAVMTGCMRISKESFFTGLNNMKVLSIVDYRFDEYFGFTQEDVEKMLADYGFEDQAGVMKEWYDGYRFGSVDVYCPWDVINHVDALCANPKARPATYWINSSGNSLVRRFVDKADKSTQLEIERLIDGEAIEKRIRLDLTYNEVDASIDNLWSVLFTTGYLTQRGEADGDRYQLIIPNREVREIFVLQIQEWFKDVMVKEHATLDKFCAALLRGDAEAADAALSVLLSKTISVRDMDSREDRKESFYHGMLIGLLRGQETWAVMSNLESGEGYSDILVETDDMKTGLVIEAKVADSFAKLDKACESALEQIEEKQYYAKLQEDGMTRILKYGIGFYKKRCMVRMGQ